MRDRDKREDNRKMKGGKKRSKLNRKCVAETDEKKTSLGEMWGDFKKETPDFSMIHT